MIRREVIGVPECPLIYRWTLLGEPTWRGKWPFKVMLHYFLPTSRDRDPHDHPRPFLTIALRGYYDDISPTGRIDRVKAPTLRYRRAEHTHMTISGPKGCWTLVVMGPKQRAWGFLRDGRWWPFKAYEEKFGHGFRCEDDA